MKKILLCVFVLLCFSGCARKETVTVDSSVPDAVEEKTILSDEKNSVEDDVLSVDVVIEQWKYYRINSPEGLRVRKTPSLNAPVIHTYPDNFLVRVTELDEAVTTVDGITSWWVKIYHNNDAEGWVFGGYLKPFEGFPEEALNVNDYRYTEYKTSYGNLTPEVLDSNWECFYIFSKDYVGEPQQFDLDAYDMYTSITYDTYKIFTGLYKDKQGTEGYFIVKTDLSETKVIQKLTVEEDDHLIVFLKPWSSDSEYLSVGRWFESEAYYYISKNNITEKRYWSDDEW